MYKIKEILIILVLFSVFISITYFSYDEYKKRKNEKVFIDILSKECFNMVTTYTAFDSYEPITSASLAIKELDLPDDIKSRVVGLCSKKIYENKN